MRKKAFTLIELIAVLVILAILALIVTPLVMNIIRKAKDSANKRSIDAYGRSVEIAIASYVLETGFLPTDLSNLEVEYKGKTVICNIMQIKENGGIYLSECKVNNVDVKDSSTDDGWYHYGTRFISDNEYVDMYGKSIEKALEEYYDANNTYPENISSLVLNYNGKTVQATSQINPDGTVYLTNCSVDGVSTDYVYGADKSTGVKALLSKTNPITITNYEDGNKSQMYTFEHPATEQTGALTDYRYIGNTPNNYAYFNDELWRIVGIFEVDDGTGNFEQRIKILRNFPSSDKVYWDYKENQYPRAINDWTNATLAAYLNNEYYNSIDNNSKQMISDSKYYLGGLTYNEGEVASGVDYYNYERGTTVYYGRNLSWIGKIGLIYPSDYIYIYAFNVNNMCFSRIDRCTGYYMPQGYNPESGWFFNYFQSAMYTISPESDYACCVVGYDYGRLSVNMAADGQFVYMPTLYLKSQVKIISGDGTVDNPYHLSL